MESNIAKISIDGCLKQISLSELNGFIKGIDIEFDSNCIGNCIEIEDNLFIAEEGTLKIILRGNNNTLQIGKNVIIHRDVTIAYIPGGPDACADNMACTIGDNCYFNGHSIKFNLGEAGTKIGIGRDCLFANSIYINTSDNHIIYDLTSNERLNPGGGWR